MSQGKNNLYYGSKSIWQTKGNGHSAVDTNHFLQPISKIHHLRTEYSTIHSGLLDELDHLLDALLGNRQLGDAEGQVAALAQ